MGILGADDFQRMDGVSMAIFGKGTLLNGGVFGADVPLDDVA